MKPWFSEAKSVSMLNAELCFLLKDELYFGPDRYIDADRSKFTQSLDLPSIPRQQPTMVCTNELIGHEDELSAYYKQVVKFAVHHGLTFNSIRHHFWLRFRLWNGEDNIHVSFPWYDSYSEISRFLNALLSVESGEIDYDIDQGWEMEADAYEDYVYLRQRDPDHDETHTCIRVPRGELVVQARQIMERSVKIINRLSDLMGEDVWTSYVRSEPVFMKKPVEIERKTWWRLW
ncbi:hypothetical protein ACIPF8_19905 [Collimonas sp. NPDC087041]|uniref:hypothetical protein n=1 Tax=Collimonas sp. NPDC087041 TaxID=3363960 RepID=UPI0038105636